MSLCAQFWVRASRWFVHRHALAASLSVLRRMHPQVRKQVNLTGVPAELSDLFRDKRDPPPARSRLCDRSLRRARLCGGVIVQLGRAGLIAPTCCSLRR